MLFGNDLNTLKAETVVRRGERARMTLTLHHPHNDIQKQLSISLNAGDEGKILSEHS